MTRENGVDDLRHYGVVVADDAGKYGAAFAEAGHQVFAELVFYAARAETRFSERTSTQLAESPGKTHGGNPQNEAYADYTAAGRCGFSGALWRYRAAGEFGGRIPPAAKAGIISRQLRRG